ncbi:MAG: glycoside hydrolase family 2 protein [Pseudobutyrivibrio sp.]|uniref:glycoside hydrolase family 2 protein n=1 Tax=Pseudobutyrivibrio sp. TaxID=2014367 RepID=UPI0025F8724B|nr:glycoside hydrolase family 2 TIM barrel-domain containing protein [Pseudobutyrivibrio sp.]MBQ6462670.1 glycoside hydrolase family 2 protein [Pseudobutyrivibrio sp.]
MAQKIYLDRKWRFNEKFEEAMIDEPMKESRLINIPHTVKETPLSYFDESIYQMESAYQKSIFAPVQWNGKVVILTFEAVGHSCDVYINGKHTKHHDCGYTAFSCDVSELLNYGEENLITVKVNSKENLDQPPFGYVIDYMTYGGIYRDVYFEIKEQTHFTDVFLQPSLLERISTSKRTSKQIKMMKVQGILKTQCYLSKNVYDLAVKERVFIKQFLGEELILSQPVGGLESDGDEYILNLTTAPTSVKLWDVESPYLYNVKTQLLLDDEVVDEFEASVGFRSSEFRKNGYYLNGRKVKLRGLNRHQSYPYVGYAMPESMQRLDAKILKDELGLNAVRTSHYPQSQYFIDECDKLGLLVFTEIPGWQHIGGSKWQDIAVENTKDMVLQYRNHPSIILWGVRINESIDNDDFYKRTNEVAHRYDPTRPTGGVRAHAKSSLLEDVYTYNDFVHSGNNKGCSKKSEITSDEEKPYLVSEYNGHMFPTKSYDPEEHRQEHAIRHANVLNAIAGESDIAGSFGWCMFDYNTHKDFGSGDRICYHGVMDMFRNPKLAASVYSAFSENDIVLDITTSFDIGEHPACNRGKSYIITNADSVKMYKNDVLVKEYFPQDSTFENLKHGPILIDDFVGDAVENDGEFTKGQAKLIKQALNQVTLGGFKITPSLAWIAFRLVVFHHVSPSKAVPIYNKFIGDWGGESREYKFEAIKDGKVVKTVKKAAVTNAHIEAKASHTLLTELHTYDVSHIRIKIADQNNNQLYFFNQPVSFEVEGPFEIIGPKVVSPVGGATGVYIKSIGEDGDGKLTISSEGLEPVEISLSVECF